MTTYPAPIGDPPSVAMIAPAKLQVDTSYQRSIESSASTRLIESIASGWDWRLCVPLIVSRRADGLYVIDGQHRRQAALRRGDIGYLPCSVSDYAGAAEEARLFVAANRGRRKIGRTDEFRAAVAAGDEISVRIDGLLREAGLHIATHGNVRIPEPGAVAFTAGLVGALKRHGDGIVGNALKLIGWAFSGQPLPHSGTMFAALCDILALQDAPPVEDLLPVLASASLEQWGEVAGLTPLKGGALRVQAMRRALRDAMVMAGGGSGALAAAPMPDAPPAEAPATPPPARQARQARPIAQQRTESAFPVSSPAFEAQLERVRRGEVGLVTKVDVPKRGATEIYGASSLGDAS